MIRRFSRPVLANLPAILSVLPLMAFALLSTTASTCTSSCPPARTGAKKAEPPLGSFGAGTLVKSEA